MFVTNDFAFVHVPKTGGQFIRVLVEKHCGILYKSPDFHEPADKIPAEYSDLPAFTLVRNPWEWYVSWYSFMLGIHDGNQIWAELSKDGTLSFKETVLRACGGSGFLEDVFEGRDLYSWYWWNFVDKAIEDGYKLTVGRQGRLRSDFITFLERNTCQGPQLRKAIMSSQRINPSKHGHYRSYYDAELRDTVGKYTRGLVERYDFSFS